MQQQPIPILALVSTVVDKCQEFSMIGVMRCRHSERAREAQQQPQSRFGQVVLQLRRVVLAPWIELLLFCKGTSGLGVRRHISGTADALSAAGGPLAMRT